MATKLQLSIYDIYIKTCRLYREKKNRLLGFKRSSSLISDRYLENAPQPACAILHGQGIPTRVWGGDAHRHLGAPFFPPEPGDLLFLLVPATEPAGQVLLRAGYTKAEVPWNLQAIREFHNVFDPPQDGRRGRRQIILLDADRFHQQLPQHPPFNEQDVMYPTCTQFLISLLETYLDLRGEEEMRLRMELAVEIGYIYRYQAEAKTPEFETQLPQRLRRLHRDLVTNKSHMGDLGSWRCQRRYLQEGEGANATESVVEAGPSLES
ncbi:hypothetical protein MAPG_02251 [Magnaporthiopsis poae ATCC 64411]|uniref:Uncharacterized protein n=1 Tax=Magnaporthiopsis poae (strain ATCC 64411 / 73-15) TaxID=644358 RepID=A0A0C4DQV4_MAGP6|nr:hypothetical protein MAPG_02251 [Magnaporthiopsis poae ATCC 64411]